MDGLISLIVSINDSSINLNAINSDGVVGSVGYNNLNAYYLVVIVLGLNEIDHGLVSNGEVSNDEVLAVASLNTLKTVLNSLGSYVNGARGVDVSTVNSVAVGVAEDTLTVHDQGATLLGGNGNGHRGGLLTREGDHGCIGSLGGIGILQGLGSRSDDVLAALVTHVGDGLATAIYARRGNRLNIGLATVVGVIILNVGIHELLIVACFPLGGTVAYPCIRILAVGILPETVNDRGQHHKVQVVNRRQRRITALAPTSRINVVNLSIRTYLQHRASHAFGKDQVALHGVQAAGELCTDGQDKTVLHIRVCNGQLGIHIQILGICLCECRGCHQQRSKCK